MSKRTKEGQFAMDLEKVLDDYLSDVLTDTEEVLVDVSDWAVGELKRKSPKVYKRAAHRKGHRHYATGWKTSVLKDKKKHYTGVVVHNSTDYSLTWLLEYGHVSKNQYGGPYKRVEGIPHIKPTQDKANQKFKIELERKLKK